MKKILTGFAVLVSVAVFSQESILFENSSFGDILNKAKREKKIVFLDAYASWCGPCKMMEKNIFPKPSVYSYFNTNFVNARIDMEKGEGPAIAQRYGVRSYPTFLFLNGDGDVVFKSLGAMNEGAFLEMAKQANDPNNNKGSLKERFKKGENDPAFLANVVRLNANTDPELAQKASERYFTVKKDMGVFTQDEVSMLLYFLKSTADSNYKVFKNNKTAITKILPENIYTQFDQQIQVNDIADKTVDMATGKVNDDYFLSNASRLLGEQEAKSALARLKINFYPVVSNFAEYEKSAIEYFGNGEGFDNSELDKAAYLFSEHVTNITSLKKAVVWAEKSIMKTETAENTFILAKLYLKTGNREAAKMFAQQASALALQSGKDNTLALKLLSEIK